MLIDDGWLSRSDLELLALSENTGGAGGFAAGMQAVAERGAPWVWVMDDDACPYEDALELIYAAAEDPNCMYGSVTIQNDRLARSEERRVGKECVSTCRSRWSP